MPRDLRGWVSRQGQARRGTTRLIDRSVPVSRIQTVEPQTPLIEAATLLNDPHRLAVVVAHGRPCGVLSAGDIIRAMDIAGLGAAPDRTRGDPHRIATPVSGPTL